MPPESVVKNWLVSEDSFSSLLNTLPLSALLDRLPQEFRVEFARRCLELDGVQLNGGSAQAIALARIAHAATQMLIVWGALGERPNGAPGPGHPTSQKVAPPREGEMTSGVDVCQISAPEHSTAENGGRHHTTPDVDRRAPMRSASGPDRAGSLPGRAGAHRARAGSPIQARNRRNGRRPDEPETATAVSDPDPGRLPRTIGDTCVLGDGGPLQEMSVRDYYAGQALAAWGEYLCRLDSDTRNRTLQPTAVARVCYAIADAMILFRKHTPEAPRDRML